MIDTRKVVQPDIQKKVKKNKDSGFDPIPYESAEIQDAGEKMEQEKAEFMARELGLSDEKINQHNRLRDEFFEKSSKLWQRKNPMEELTFKDRRQMIDILLVRFSSMGDVVLQTATINWLRSLLGKEARFSFVTSSEFVSLLNTHPEISHVIGFNRRGGEKWSDLVKKIDEIDNKEPIDLILDLHATLRSFRLKLSFWTIPTLTVDKRRWERFFLTKIKNVKLKRFFDKKVFGLEPQVERIIKDFEGIFLDTKSKRRTVDFRKGPHQELTSLAATEKYPIGGEYVVLAPSASFLYKRWPVNNFVELAKKILEETQYHLVVLAGPEDKFCDAFNVIANERLHNLQGKTSLKESMNVLAFGKLCIGNDSGMNHIAEAYGVPCVTIFGPTDPKFGFAPHGSKSQFLSKEMFCKPCSTTGKTPCYRDRHYCMEEISVDEVKTTAFNVLRT
jgi:ADP-heptose:LPS heptosyltransferase